MPLLRVEATALAGKVEFNAEISREDKMVLSDEDPYLKGRTSAFEVYSGLHHLFDASLVNCWHGSRSANRSAISERGAQGTQANSTA
jgi:hypothetical protein